MSLIKFELKKVEKGNRGYPLSFRILEQSEKLNSKKYLIDFGFSALYIWSSNCPQIDLEEGTIFIRGSNRTKDNEECICYFSTERNRDSAYDLIILAFKRLKDYVD